MEVESPVLIMADLALFQDQDLLSVVDSSDNTQLVLEVDFRSENKTKMYILVQEQENKMYAYILRKYAVFIGCFLHRLLYSLIGLFKIFFLNIFLIAKLGSRIP